MTLRYILPSSVRDLHLGLSIDLEIMQHILSDSRSGFIGIFDKGDIFLCGDSTNLDKSRMSETSASTILTLRKGELTLRTLLVNRLK